MAEEEDARLLSLCGGCAPLAAESRFLGIQFASVGPWKLRVVAIDCGGPLELLGKTPETATPLVDRSVQDSSGVWTVQDTRRPNDNTGLVAFFVHGGGGRAGQFRHLIHYLAQRGVRCVAPDLPGHGVSQLLKGPSGAPQVCSREDAQNILKATFDALAGTRKGGPSDGAEGGPPRPLGAPNNPQRRAVLIGHSFGSLQALRLYEQLEAEGRGGEVAALCLIAGDTAERVRGVASWLLLSLPRFVLKLLRSFLSSAVQRLLYCSDSRKQRKSMLEQERLITSTNSFDTVLQALADVRSGAAHKDFQAAAAAFRRSASRPPVLMLYGEEDAITPPASCAANMSAALGGGPLPAHLPRPSYLGLPYSAVGGPPDEGDASESSLVSPAAWAKSGAVTAVLVAHAGHNCMLEQPQATNQVVWDFVKQQATQ
ncbi:hypothetical protein Emed_001252 [Eimeria media]